MVKVEVNNFIMDSDAIGRDKVPGRGHWHLYLDGEWTGATAEEIAMLERVSAGLHHVRVALANNDHSPVLPPAEDTVIIDVDFDNSAAAAAEPDEIATSGDNEPEWAMPEEDASLHFVSSNPTHGEEIYYELEAITLTFDFNLAPESSIELTYKGELVPLGSVEISSDQLSMSAPILEALTLEGVYEVSYKPCWPYLNCHSGKFAVVVEFEKRNDELDPY